MSAARSWAAEASRPIDGGSTEGVDVAIGFIARDVDATGADTLVFGAVIAFLTTDKVEEICVVVLTVCITGGVTTGNEKFGSTVSVVEAIWIAVTGAGALCKPSKK